MKLIGISVIAASVLLAVGAPLAHAAKRPRPTDVPLGQAVSVVAPDEIQVYNDYASPARSYVSLRAVVHYVVLGIDAPPLNDDDGDGVPDYVERVGAAADAAIAYFERRGFARILPDAGGPDAKPDVYVTRFAPGYFGVALPSARAQGGAFVVVSNGLDPSAERSLGSLYGTVAHELFHLVQFSYYPPSVDPPLPPWVLEGSAAALESRVYPGLADLVSSLQLRPWFEDPEHSLTRQSYGAQLLWGYLDRRAPRLLPSYLRLAATAREASLAGVLAQDYRSLTGRPFAAAFGSFAVWVEGEYGARFRPLRTMAPAERAHGRVAPLSIHYLRLSRRVRSLSVRPSATSVRLQVVYELESDTAGEPAATRRLPARSVGGSLVYTVPASLARSPRFTMPTLVIANGDASSAARYDVATR